jgi:hypothetical protein
VHHDVSAEQQADFSLCLPRGAPPPPPPPTHTHPLAQEREELLAAQAGCDDAQLGALRADLVKQLDGHIAALQQRKQAAGA